MSNAVYLETDGTTTTRYQIVSRPDLQHIGPYLCSVQLMTLTSNRTSNHQWKAVLEYSGDDRNWYPSTPLDLCPWVTEDGHVIHPPVYGANFSAPFVRLSLATANSTGTARESASLWLWLTLRRAG